MPEPSESIGRANSRYDNSSICPRSVEDLKNDQVVLLIVRGQGDIRLACGAGAHGKVRDMLDDALQSIGGEGRRR